MILIGNLGKDPEVRHLENGTSVANFSLATTETYKDKSGQRQSQTEWHNIVLWRGLAEIAEKYLKKGNPVYIEGKIRSRSWNDKDGITRYTTEIVADNMTMLGSKRDNEERESNYQSQDFSGNEDRGSVSEEPKDDLPF